jgi:hypothetical protein
LSMSRTMRVCVITWTPSGSACFAHMQGLGPNGWTPVVGRTGWRSCRSVFSTEQHFQTAPPRTSPLAARIGTAEEATVSILLCIDQPGVF